MRFSDDDGARYNPFIMKRLTEYYHTMMLMITPTHVPSMLSRLLHRNRNAEDLFEEFFFPFGSP